MQYLAAAVLACVAASAVAIPALADGNRPDWAFGHPGGEVAIAALALGSNATFFLDQQSSSWAPSHVRPFDPVVSEWSDLVGAVGGAAIQLGVGYVTESAYLAEVGATDPSTLSLYGSLVETEALFLSSGTTFLIKRLSGRCRPRSYRNGSCSQFDAFPSGHTAAISPFAGSRLVRLVETEGDGLAFRAIGYAAAEVGTFTTAVLRVMAGAHSWEDVLVGGLIGHASGVLVALAHPPVAVTRDAGKARSPMATMPATVTFSFSF